MCCRYLLFRSQLKEMLRQVGAVARAERATRYNIAPGTKIPAVRKKSGPVAELEDLRWGLVPAWSKAAQGFVNARAENLAEKPSFREAFRERRCLIPASGFYEWRNDGRRREPWLFRLAGEEPFFLAGLWEPGNSGDDTCTVITTEPNGLMRPIHPRMPAILEGAAAERWLDPATTRENLEPLLAPYPADRMTAVALGPRVNSTAHDDEACLQPADTNSAGRQDELAL